MSEREIQKGELNAFRLTTSASDGIEADNRRAAWFTIWCRQTEEGVSSSNLDRVEAEY